MRGVVHPGHEPSKVLLGHILYEQLLRQQTSVKSCSSRRASSGLLAVAAPHTLARRSMSGLHACLRNNHIADPEQSVRTVVWLTGCLAQHHQVSCRCYSWNSLCFVPHPMPLLRVSYGSRHADCSGCCRCWRCLGKACRGAAKQRSPFWPHWTPSPFTACHSATGCGSATMGSGSNLWTLCTLRSSPTSKGVQGLPLAV